MANLTLIIESNLLDFFFDLIKDWRKENYTKGSAYNLTFDTWRTTKIKLTYDLAKGYITNITRCRINSQYRTKTNLLDVNNMTPSST